jgi:hypothetical protein
MARRSTVTTSIPQHPPARKLDAKNVARLFDLRLPAFARILGESVAKVKSHSSDPKLQRKLQRFIRIYNKLAVIFPINSIPKWLHHPMRRLGSLTPLELLEQHDIAKLEALVTEISEGAYA